MEKPVPPEGLSAREFFERGLDGCSMSDAQKGTGIAYSTIHALKTGKGEGGPRKNTLDLIHKWSLEAGRPYGVYISVAKTLGIDTDDGLHHADATPAATGTR